MKKRAYISPETVRLEMEAVAQVLSGSQKPYVEAKQHQFESINDNPFDDENDNPWETVNRPKDLWE